MDGYKSFKCPLSESDNFSSASRHYTNANLTNSFQANGKQRCQANARERDRTQNLSTNVGVVGSLPSSVNSAFNTLRLLIPTEPADRKLSKIEILRLAGSYITHLDNQLYTGNMEKPCLQSEMEPNGQVCTFCWTAVKKEKSSNSSNHYYRLHY